MKGRFLIRVFALSAAFSVAACSGRQSDSVQSPTDVVTETDTNRDGSGFGPPLLFSSFFDEGRLMHYREEHRQAFHEPADPAADADGMVTEESSVEVACRVEEVRQFATSLVSRVSCECGPDHGERCLFSGFYGATADGFFGMSESPETEEALFAIASAEETYIMAASPEPMETSEEDTILNVTTHVRVFQDDGGAWCWNHDFVSGNETSITFCFGNDGILRNYEEIFSADGHMNERRATFLRSE